MRRSSLDRSAAFAQALEAWDQERTALARVLHDTVLQRLAAASMNLSVAGNGDVAQQSAIVAESARLLDETITEIRAISYCAEPPFAADIGLKAAIDAFANAFVRLRARPFAVSEMPPRCAGLTGPLASAIVNSIRDAAHALAEDGAVALRAGGTLDEEELTVYLEADLAGDSAPRLRAAAATAGQRLRPFYGAAEAEVGTGFARLSVRAPARGAP